MSYLNFQDRSNTVNYKTVNVISQEDFEKLAPRIPKKQNPEVPPPPPPPLVVRLLYIKILLTIK